MWKCRSTRPEEATWGFFRIFLPHDLDHESILFTLLFIAPRKLIMTGVKKFLLELYAMFLLSLFFFCFFWRSGGEGGGERNFIQRSPSYFLLKLTKRKHCYIISLNFSSRVRCEIYKRIIEREGIRKKSEIKFSPTYGERNGRYKQVGSVVIETSSNVKKETSSGILRYDHAKP